MTPALLIEAGVALYGPRWQSDLARALGVSDRTVRRWAVGQNRIPAEMADALAEIMAKRAISIDCIRDRIIIARTP